VIVVWRRCVDCGHDFGLTRRQCHGGLLGRRIRCGPCRREHRRAFQRRWDRERRIRPESAPVYAAAGLNRLVAAFTGQEGADL
jgi:hypothetical protein